MEKIPICARSKSLRLPDLIFNVGSGSGLIPSRVQFVIVKEEIWDLELFHLL